MSAMPDDNLPQDLESRVIDDHHQAIKLWLRMLACTTRIESVVRNRLRSEFATTLPRFDLLAQLEREPEGLTMGDVVKATVFLAADPKTGKLEFAAMNSEFVKYFGTKDQPNKPARSAVQVAALVAPGAALEIEVIAVKSKK